MTGDPMRRPTRWTVLSVGLALTVGALVAAPANTVAWRQTGALPTTEQAVAVVRAGLPAASVTETAWQDTTRDEIVGTPGPGGLPGERYVVVSPGTVSRADVAAARGQLARKGWQVS